MSALRTASTRLQAYRLASDCITVFVVRHQSLSAFAVTRQMPRRLLVRTLALALDWRSGVPPIDRSDNGKPDLHSRLGRRWAVSLSRCRDASVLALAPCRALGIDVESTRDAHQARDAMSVFLSSTEADATTRSKHPDRALNLWVQKEAILKRLGTGLWQDPKAVQLERLGHRFFHRDSASRRTHSAGARINLGGCGLILSISSRPTQLPVRFMDVGPRGIHRMRLGWSGMLG